MSRRTFIKSLSDSVVPTVANTIVVNMQKANERSAVLVKLFESAFAEELASEAVSDPEKITGFLSYWAEELDVKNIGYVSLETDTYYDSLGQVLSLDYDSERDSWIKNFISDPAHYRSNFYEPEEIEREGLYSLFHDRKIYNDKGKLTAIIGLGLDLVYVDSSVGGLGQKISISFLDQAGNYRLPIKRRGKNIEDQLSLREEFPKDRAYDGITEAVSLNDGSRKLLLYFMSMPELERTMMIEIDITAFLNDYRRQNIQVFIFGMILSVLIVIPNFIFINLSSKRMSKKAYTDSLTKCYNRTFADRLVSKKMLHDDVNYSLMLFDIDHFKIINDRQGHAAGDQILRRIASIASEHLRSEDFLIRWGGDEFVAILQTGLKNSAAIAERIRITIAENTDATISAGLSPFLPGLSFEQALHDADGALYRSKAMGRNTVCADSSY